MLKHRFDRPADASSSSQQREWFQIASPTCVVVVIGAGVLGGSSEGLRPKLGLPPEAARGAVIILCEAPPASGAHAGSGELEQLPVAGSEWLGDGARLEAGRCYLVPPSCRLWFEGERPRVAPRGLGEHHPIDRLLLSLAEGWGERSVALVAVSGEDGECGLRAIREVGGVTLERLAASEVQAPLARRPSGAAQPRRRPSSAPPRPGRGLVLSARLLERASAACQAAMERAGSGGRVRVWVPRCRGGMLTYAVAMLLADAAASATPRPKVLVFGTDDDEEALARARAGRYPAQAALGLEPELRGRHTFDEGETIRIAEALREICIFSRQKLLRDAPMARMSLIVCHRVFEGVPASKRRALAEQLHYSLRDGGVLLPLDHVDQFPEDLFQRMEGGYLQALPLRARALPGLPGLERLLQSERACKPARCKGAPGAWSPAAVEAFVNGVGLPLVLLDPRLCVAFSSSEAQQSFGLSDADQGLSVAALWPQLPGGSGLLAAARRVLISGELEELASRVGERAYLARVSPAEPGVAITFIDVTALEAANAQALAQRHQQAAIARISDLALTVGELTSLYDEALEALFGNICVCSAGLIAELDAAGTELELTASRGLGSDPLGTLRALGEPARLLEAAREQGRAPANRPRLSAPGAEADPPASSRRIRPRSTQFASALPFVAGGLACPILDEGVVLGVIALYGSRPGIEDSEHQHFVQAVANVLGAALVRQRTRRRLGLELEVSALLAGASEPEAIGEGLMRAFGGSLGADGVEIWRASEERPGEWAPVLAPQGGAAAWPAGLERLPPGAGLHFSASDGARELYAPLGGCAPAVLRLWGARLLPPDRELAVGLERVSRMLGEFLERLRILELSRQNEASYRRKSAELEALYASLPVGVSIHDLQGKIWRVNRHLAPLTGTGPGEGARALRRLYREEVPNWVQRVLQTGEPIHDVELSVAMGEQEFHWLCNFAPVTDSRGKLHGVSAVVQDISPMKQVEASLREADQQKDDFLALLGHELRNPMAAIRNATELLGRVEGPSPQLSRLQSIFDRQTLQTTRLIDGLLDVARVARGKVQLALAPLPLVQLVRQVVDDRRQQFGERVLDVRLPEQELWVHADRVRMVQILDNLISNALKFTAPGGRIRIEVQHGGQGGRLSIEDDGAGIEPELLPEIFEPFRQGRASGFHPQVGLGLGLALVKALVDLHGFRLHAHSDGAGRGASFSIDLPAMRPPEVEPPPSRVDLRPLELLLVEDNPDIAETLAELLSDTGHRVQVVGCGEEALEALRGWRPDVVLCDIGLPGMDGLELAARLRSDPDLAALKLIAMTGYGDAATQSRVAAVGFDRMLIKPVQLEALSHCLARVARAPRAGRS